MQRRGRRKFLLYLIASGGGLICLSVVVYRQIAAVIFRRSSPRIHRPLEELVDAGPLSQFHDPGVYTTLKESHGVWVIHAPDGNLSVLRTLCTHLGCTPDWNAESKKFVCPCHGSEYDATGVNVRGPTKRPLERLMVRAVAERLYIDKETVFRKERGEWNDPDAAIDLRAD